MSYCFLPQSLLAIVFDNLTSQCVAVCIFGIFFTSALRTNTRQSCWNTRLNIVYGKGGSRTGGPPPPPRLKKKGLVFVNFQSIYANILILHAVFTICILFTTLKKKNNIRYVWRVIKANLRSKILNLRILPRRYPPPPVLKFLDPPLYGEFDTACNCLRENGGTSLMSSDWLTSRFDAPSAVCFLDEFAKILHTVSDHSHKERMISMCSPLAVAFFASSGSRLVF